MMFERARRLFRWLCCGLLLAGLGPPGAALRADSGPRSPEYLVKAAYLYNFALFVEWPPDAFAGPEDPLVIGIVGTDPFGWALDQALDGRRISRRRIVVERLQANQDLRHCQMVFIASSERERMPELLLRLQGQPVLVVADYADASRHPTTVDFVVTDNKVGFTVNLDAARRARLKISSKMLGLARAVR